MKRLVVYGLSACMFASCYVTRQGVRQVGLLLSQEPIDQTLKQHDLAEKDRQKLEFTAKVLEFSRDQGLKVGDSYRHFIRLNGDAVSYTVQAALPTSLELKTWWFPVIGRVPYLGFFDREDREREAQELEEEGYEIHRGSVAAYSSLGWFSDPIYSSMLKRSDAELAHLYFHELTHRTLWLKDGVEFNENLGEFIADELTNQFFEILNRPQDIQELTYYRDDYGLFKAWLLALRKNLKQSLDETAGKPLLERVRDKNAVISMAVQKKPSFKRIDFVGSGIWNNARILAAGLYSPDTAAFEHAAACFGGRKTAGWAGNFLKTLGKLAETSRDGFGALNAMCGH